MPSVTLDNEKELMHSISEGDEQAFAQLFRHCVPALEPFIRKITRSDSGTLDVIQETFIRVWLKRDKLPTLDKPVSWLFRVAANECFTWLNREAAHRKKSALAVVREETPGETGMDHLSVEETAQLIQRAVSKLPARRRLIYELSRQEGLSSSEIAAQLKLSQSYVKNTLAAALQSIRDYLIAAGKVIPLLYVILHS